MARRPKKENVLRTVAGMTVLAGVGTARATHGVFSITVMRLGGRLALVCGLQWRGLG